MDTPVFLRPSDVARVFNVSRQRVISNWKKRGTGPLPAPAAYVGQEPVWTVAQIREIVEGALQRCDEQIRRA